MVHQPVLAAVVRPLEVVMVGVPLVCAEGCRASQPARGRRAQGLSQRVVGPWQPRGVPVGGINYV